MSDLRRVATHEETLQDLASGAASMRGHATINASRAAAWAVDELATLRAALFGLQCEASNIADSLLTYTLGNMDVRRYRRWEEADAAARAALNGTSLTGAAGAVRDTLPGVPNRGLVVDDSITPYSIGSLVGQPSTHPSGLCDAQPSLAELIEALEQAEHDRDYWHAQYMRLAGEQS
jgi:hypothetical protein